MERGDADGGDADYENGYCGDADYGYEDDDGEDDYGDEYVDGGEDEYKEEHEYDDEYYEKAIVWNPNFG